MKDKVLYMVGDIFLCSAISFWVLMAASMAGALEKTSEPDRSEQAATISDSD